MDRYDAMRVFTRIVERRSFTLAAQDLGLPRTTVTDAIKALERRLDVRLLERTTRHVRPTIDGEAYYSRCLQLIADMEDAESAFANAEPGGLLRVDVSGSLARHVIIPRLPEFLDRYPRIELVMSEGDRFVDLVGEGIDCVIRTGQLQDSDMVARRLMLTPEVTCAAPAYCARFGVPETLDGLAGHRMIGFRSSATGATLPLEFMTGNGVRLVTLPASMTVTGAQCYLAAALAGLGLIQSPRHAVHAHIDAGRLVAILPDTPPTPSPISLLYPRSKQQSRRLRAFADWVQGVFKELDGATP